MNENLLELNDVSKAFFGVYAVRGVTLAIQRGHIVGLIGQNGAGKSTLMNIIGGVVRLDAGVMLVNSQLYQPNSPADATQAGIAFIHQELNLFTNLSIAENIFISSFPLNRWGAIDRKQMFDETQRLLEQVDISHDPGTLVEQLSPGERQLVEIAKAMHSNANLIIFDEPTTSLTARETEKLFEIIGRLRELGKTMIYISHILADVVRLADEVTVLRDGEIVGTRQRAEFDIKEMIGVMVGRSIEQLYPPRLAAPSNQPVLEVRSLSQPGIVERVNFTLAHGEILGLFGLMGSGRTELARIIFGLDSYETGEIVIEQKTLRGSSPQSSLQHRIAFVTENRREEGLLMSLPIAENISLTALPRFAVTPLQLIEQARLVTAVQQTAGVLQIKAGAIEQQEVKSLSGGNQQKVVIAKWLMSHPAVFLMDEPTRGVDVGAKYEIYSIVNALAAEGAGILFISSELEELIGMCDRILVMSRGEMVGEFAQADFKPEQILRTAFREKAIS